MACSYGVQTSRASSMADSDPDGILQPPSALPGTRQRGWPSEAYRPRDGREVVSAGVDGFVERLQRLVGIVAALGLFFGRGRRLLLAYEGRAQGQLTGHAAKLDGISGPQRLS